MLAEKPSIGKGPANEAADNAASSRCSFCNLYPAWYICFLRGWLLTFILSCLTWRNWRRLTAPRAWDRRFRGLKLPERPARSGDELQSSGEPHDSSLPADASSDPLQRSDALKTVFDAR